MVSLLKVDSQCNNRENDVGDLENHQKDDVKSIEDLKMLQKKKKINPSLHSSYSLTGQGSLRV